MVTIQEQIKEEISKEVKEFRKPKRTRKVGELTQAQLKRLISRSRKAKSKRRPSLEKPGKTYKEVRQIGTHLMGALTGTPVSKSGSKGDRGRGRPRETYKVRVLPSGRVVKVPTHVYKKMLSAEKAQMRLIQVQSQMQAEQVAMQQDPRFQPSAEDQFLAEPDQQHEMDVLRAKQEIELEQQMQQYPQQRPGVGQKIIKGVGDFGRGVSRLGRVRRPQMVDQFGRPIEQFSLAHQPMGAGARGMEIRGEPRVTAVSERANLLNVPNVFNNPGQSSILWNKRRRLY